MKKRTTITIISLLIIQIISYSQWGWFQLSSGTSNQLNDIRFYNETGWAVGNNGLILKTTNYGQNWSTQPSGTNSNLKSIDFRYGYGSWFGLISGSGGTILKSTNPEGPWNQVSSGTINNLNAIHITNDTNTILTAGDNGTIRISFNMGQSWQTSNSNTAYNLHSIIETYELFAVGDNGTIIRSFDMGFSWFSVPSGTNNNLYSITRHYNPDGILISVGENGIILKSSNSGQSWLPVTSGTTNNLFSAWSYFQGMNNTEISYYFASGANGTVLISADSGTTWHKPYIPVNENLNSINFVSINTGFAAGANGTILKTISNHHYIDTKKMDANTISTWFSNAGIFNYDMGAYAPGFEWPKGSGHHARYGSGLWLGAIVGGDTLVATLQYNQNEYYPGFTDNFGIPYGRNDSNYRIYKMIYGENNNDRMRWPNAVLGNSNQGAPVYFDTTANSWKPLDFGSQTMYYIYTDSYPESHINGFGGTTAPLKADVKQLNFALDVNGAMGNVIITQFTIINRSNSVWNNAYFTIWTDDDIGNQSNDKIGCDSALSLGYTYNNGFDTAYGSAVPAVGFLLLKGAVVYTGSINDTIHFCKNKTNASLIRYKDLGMNVFNLSINGDINYHDPESYNESYNLMKGLRTSGQPIINPYGGFVTKLFYSGNPVTGTGWNQAAANDVRFYISTGPINMNPGDTQTIVTAQIIARGTSSLNSITVLRQYADIVKQYYQSCYTSIPIGIESLSEIAKEYSLYQNYPNPFNPKTVISFQLAVNSLTKLTVYDILGREIKTLVNEQLKPGTYEVEFDGTDLPSGVYFYKLIAGQLTETKKMVIIK